MLHITNGDSAARVIVGAGIPGDVLPWRDVLHAGPVPSPATLDSLRPLRARFLAEMSGRPAPEIAGELEQRDRRLGALSGDGDVTLWFEHDLYDQLQLAQILDRLASERERRPSGSPRITLIQTHDYVSSLTLERARTLWDARADVTAAQFHAARRAWSAFSSDHPRAIEAALDHVGDLPFMRAALVRLLEEYPAVATGLSRIERQALDALAVAPAPVSELFRTAHLEREDPVWLSDLVFARLVRGLTAGDEPLVHAHGDTVAITATGRDVLAGRRDRVATLGIDRWLGGVHLKGRRVPFRWDPARRTIVAADSR